MKTKPEKMFTVEEARIYSKQLIKKLAARNENDYPKNPPVKKIK